MRRVDAANISVNLTQLVTILGLAWYAFEKYDTLRDQVAATDERMIQIQSQLGETNARLARLP